MNNENMKLERITDRTIYSMFAVFNCSYTLYGDNLSERTCTMRINRAYRDIFQSKLLLTCPWTMVGIRKTLTSISSVNAKSTNIECTHALQIEVEDADDKPEKIALGLITLVLDRINRDSNLSITKAEITSEITLQDMIKGYLQLDETIYFPSIL